MSYTLHRNSQPKGISGGIQRRQQPSTVQGCMGAAIPRSANAAVHAWGTSP